MVSVQNAKWVISTIKADASRPGRLIAFAVAGWMIASGGCGGQPDEAIRVEAPRNPVLSRAEIESRYREAFQEGARQASHGQYAYALAAFQEALSLRPDAPEAMFNLAACYEMMGDPLEAIKLYRRVLSINPNDADCHANLGTSYIKLYYRERSPAWRRMAREAWKSALRLNPEQPGVADYLARTEGLE